MTNKIKNLKKKVKNLKEINGYLDTKFPKDLSAIGLTDDMFWWKKNQDRNHKEYIKKHGFDFSENFSLFTWVALNLYPRLIEFNKNKMSYPCGMSFKEWTDIIDKMILAFKIIIEDEYNVSLDTGKSTISSKGEVKFIKNKNGNSTMDFSDYTTYIDGIDTNTEEYKKYTDNRQKLVDEGLKLFAKHFESLWD